MKRSEMYPSKYLSADDIDGEVVVTIKSVRMETMKDNEGQEQEKPVVFFKESQKAMVLNKTNADRIFEQVDEDTDNWPGKQITLIVESVTAFGETKWAIRVKPTRPAPKAGALKSALKAEPATVSADDEPPF